MQLRNKYYPYPVIVDGGEYYDGSTFTSHLTQEMDGYNVKLIMSVDLNDQLLSQKINEGEVVFFFYIECPQTCFRKVVKTNDATKEIIIRDGDVNGIVQVCSFVVAEKDIEKYTNESFSSEYRGWKFNIEKGCILAIGNQYNVRINKIKDDLSNTSSIFSIVPNKDQSESSALVSLEQQKIIIKLPEQTYQQYYQVEQQFSYL